MAKKKGSLLEENVKMIFDLVGIKSKNNVRISDYEIDVLAVYQGITIAVECKQYERSELNVDNLIFQWSGKNKKIKADKVVLVVYGTNMSRRQYQLAKEERIIVWKETDLQKFLEMAIKDSKKALVEILDNLDIRTEDVMKKREEEEKSWIPNYQQIYHDYIWNQKGSIWHHHSIIFYTNTTCMVELFDYLHNKETDFRLFDFEKNIKLINEKSLKPIRTIILPDVEIGKEEVEIADRYDVRCLVCKKARWIEIDTSIAKVLVLTIDEIKKKVELSKDDKNE